MNGKRKREPDPPDWRAAQLLDQLMGDRGWNPRDVERASQKTGGPQRVVSYSTIYRVLRSGHVPRRPQRREIAAVFGLRQSQIWQGDTFDDTQPPTIAAASELVAA